MCWIEHRRGGEITGARPMNPFNCFPSCRAIVDTFDKLHFGCCDLGGSSGPCGSCGPDWSYGLGGSCSPGGSSGHSRSSNYVLIIFF